MNPTLDKIGHIVARIMAPATYREKERLDKADFIRTEGRRIAEEMMGSDIPKRKTQYISSAQLNDEQDDFVEPDFKPGTLMSENYIPTLRETKKLAKELNFPFEVAAAILAAEGRGTSKYAKERNNFTSYQAYTENPDAARSFEKPVDSVRATLNAIMGTTGETRYKQPWENYLKQLDSKRLIEEIAPIYATDPEYSIKATNTPEWRKYYSK
jgi:hypothetical protein